MRRALLIAGLVVLAAAWLGPLPRLASGAFWAHMTLHMGVVAVAAPLLALGLAGGRYDPVRRAPRLLAPIPASAVELLVVWGWHAPALHHFARSHGIGLAAEQGSFLLAGLAVWLSAFGGDPQNRGRAAAGVVGLLLTAMHMTLLGALLALTPRPLYSHAVAAAGGLSPMDDQHLGGAVMVAVGSAAYLLGGLWLTVRLLRSRAVPAEGGA